MKSRWYNYRGGKPKGPRGCASVAERQLHLLRARPLVLPEGADPELVGLFSAEVRP